ncbi:pimeloyl-ACP methyl ester carboxylesterase [Hoeflea marina]|uniref:Pimeloyl-ACP methyl ester carboxylesterase n=1 Tax=Hoeflea marina TaxID=274592 RepID=A0A317PR91_9HYPH|nr:alpha/beta hydrolase [Hoeflea marina]PWW03998.1 pimeloyl-ACP methyl ester carboxylesterase [Hoeflea marina]
MNLDKLQANRFTSGSTELTWYEGGHADGVPVLLIHGFASTAHVNWVYPGWFKSLGDAGYRVLALDNRGHGQSDKPHDAAAYTPEIMAADAAGLLDELGIDHAHVMGYSMGARITAFLALARPDLVRSAVFGGLGLGMIDGVGDWDPIAAALMADSIDDVIDERGRMFRAFADQTKSDRQALAACISTSRTLIDRADLARLTMPILVAVGTRDEIAGAATDLAEMLPNGRGFDIANRDHMLAVGDRSFKAEVLRFFTDVEAGTVG